MVKKFTSNLNRRVRTISALSGFSPMRMESKNWQITGLKKFNSPDYYLQAEINDTEIKNSDFSPKNKS